MSAFALRAWCDICKSYVLDTDPYEVVDELLRDAGKEMERHEKDTLHIVKARQRVRDALKSGCVS